MEEDRINSVISRINKHIREIEERGKRDLNNLETFDALSMSCLQLTNALIDLGKLVIARKHLGSQKPTLRYLQS